MKQLIFILSLLLVLACESKQQHKTHHEKQNDEHMDQKQEKEHGKGKQHPHGSVNEYMHQSSLKDLIDRFESPERDEYQQPEKVLEYLGNIDGQKIMDIGAGSGYFSVKLAERGALVIAADVDDEFQEFLSKRIAENNLQGIETRKIPFDAPGLSAREVDKVLMVNTYHHIENRPEYFTKLRQGIKVDGQLIIIDFFKVETPVGPGVNHKISMDKVIYELREAGFSSFDVNVDLLPYQYIIRAK